MIKRAFVPLFKIFKIQYLLSVYCFAILSLKELFDSNETTYCSSCCAIIGHKKVTLKSLGSGALSDKMLLVRIVKKKIMLILGHVRVYMG